MTFLRLVKHTKTLPSLGLLKQAWFRATATVISALTIPLPVSSWPLCCSATPASRALSEEGEKQVTIVGTLACGEAETKTVEVKLYLNKATNYVVDDCAEMPTAGTAFKLHVTQTQLNQELYITGNIANKTYLETTNNPEEAVDVKAELVAGTTNEYYLYIQPGRTKSYIYIYNGNHDQYGANYYLNIGLLPVQDATTDIPTHTWSWNAEYNTFVTTQKFHKTDKNGNSPEAQVYIGTYNNYNTLSASQISYAATSMVSHPANIINGDTATTAEKLAKDNDDGTQWRTIAYKTRIICSIAKYIRL